MFTQSRERGCYQSVKFHWRVLEDPFELKETRVATNGDRLRFRKYSCAFLFYTRLRVVCLSEMDLKLNKFIGETNMERRQAHKNTT